MHSWKITGDKFKGLFGFTFSDEAYDWGPSYYPKNFYDRNLYPGPGEDYQGEAFVAIVMPQSLLEDLDETELFEKVKTLTQAAKQDWEYRKNQAETPE